MRTIFSPFKCLHASSHHRLLLPLMETVRGYYDIKLLIILLSTSKTWMISLNVTVLCPFTIMLLIFFPCLSPKFEKKNLYLRIGLINVQCCNKAIFKSVLFLILFIIELPRSFYQEVLKLLTCSYLFLSAFMSQSSFFNFSFSFVVTWEDRVNSIW